VGVALDQAKMTYWLGAELNVSNELEVIPTNSYAAFYDLEIVVPFELPQNNVAIELKTLLHLSDMLGKDDNDIITANITYNQDEIVKAVLNNAYIYLDISGLDALLLEEGEYDVYDAYKYEFKESLWDMLFEGLFGLFGIDVDIEPNIEDVPTTPDYSHGYSMAEANFPVGTELEDVLAAIEASYSYEYGEVIVPVEIKDTDFDSTSSGYKKITIVYPDGVEDTITIGFYDMQSAVLQDIYVATLFAPKGANAKRFAADAEICLNFEDGEVEFCIYGSGSKFADDAEFVDADGNLSTAGCYKAVLIYTTNGVDYSTNETTLYVYDSEDLQVAELYCENCFDIVAEEGYSNADIVEQMVMYVMYDNGETDQVFDVTLNDDFVYRKGETMMVTVCYIDGNGQLFTCDVEVREKQQDDYGYEPDNGYEPIWGDDDDYIDDGIDFEAILESVLPCLRFVSMDESDDVVTLIMDSIENLGAIFEQNGELFENVFAITEKEGKYELRIALNNAQNQDLLAVLNLFIGIPKEEGGWDDITEQKLYDLIEDKTVISTEQGGETITEEGSDNTHIYDIFEHIVGVELKEVLAQLDLNIVLDWSNMPNGAELSVVLDNGDGVTYLKTGCRISWVQSGAQFELTKEQMEKVKEFKDFDYKVLKELVSSITGMEFDSDEEIE
jgi:hypothetical protein